MFISKRDSKKVWLDYCSIYSIYNSRVFPNRKPVWKNQAEAKKYGVY